MQTRSHLRECYVFKAFIDLNKTLSETIFLKKINVKIK